MRRYEQGVIVGEPTPVPDFEAWLRGEIAHAKKLIDETSAARQAASWYPRGRLVALQETLRVWERQPR